jgi:transglutaminase-like putative cysteine protease
MSFRYFLFFLILISLTTFTSSSVFAGAFPRLEKLPRGEQWFIISFSDDRAGFSYVRINENDRGYELYSESAVKMSGFAFSRDATMKETYMVNPDLTLRSFTVKQTIDGTSMIVQGESSPTGIKAVVESEGSKKEKFLKSKKAVYPPMALNFLPLLRGVAPGKKLKISMLDTEAVKLKNVEVTVVGTETFRGVKAMHMRNDLYPVDNDIWVDAKGNTIEESVRDGWIVTRAEDENTVRKFISEAALSGKDFILKYGRIKVDTPISEPGNLKKLEVEISGYSAGSELPAGVFQTAERPEDDKVLFTIYNSPMPEKTENAVTDTGIEEFLRPTELIPSGAPVFKSTADGIVGDEKDPAGIAGKLARWVATNVNMTSSDSRSPLETLRDKEGNPADMARLYVTLARAIGLPSKLVSGLVYVPDIGFIYRSWAECHVGYWMPVDPVVGETPADAAHIKLVEGDSPEAMVALSRFIGHVDIKVIKKEY